MNPTYHLLRAAPERHTDKIQGHSPQYAAVRSVARSPGGDASASLATGAQCPQTAAPKVRNSARSPCLLSPKTRICTASDVRNDQARTCMHTRKHKASHAHNHHLPWTAAHLRPCTHTHTPIFRFKPKRSRLLSHSSRPP